MEDDIYLWYGFPYIFSSLVLPPLPPPQHFVVVTSVNWPQLGGGAVEGHALLAWT